MVGRKAGVATKFKEKLLTVNSDHQIHSVHCIIHRKVLCSKTLQMDHIMDVVIKAVNFIRAQGSSTAYWRKFTLMGRLPYHTYCIYRTIRRPPIFEEKNLVLSYYRYIRQPPFSCYGSLFTHP